MRGLRGATTVAQDEADAILDATEELLQALLQANDLAASDVVSGVFTVTPDLTAEYPARAARRLGWSDAALIGAVEMAVPGGLPRCIRVLLHVSTSRAQGQMRHVYMREAVGLRPDRTL